MRFALEMSVRHRGKVIHIGVGCIADIDGLLVLLTDLREHMQRGLGWDHVLPV